MSISDNTSSQVGSKASSGTEKTWEEKYEELEYKYNSEKERWINKQVGAVVQQLSDNHKTMIRCVTNGMLLAGLFLAFLVGFAGDNDGNKYPTESLLGLIVLVLLALTRDFLFDFDFITDKHTSKDVCLHMHKKLQTLRKKKEWIRDAIVYDSHGFYGKKDVYFPNKVNQCATCSMTEEDKLREQVKLLMRQMEKNVK